MNPVVTALKAFQIQIISVMEKVGFRVQVAQIFSAHHLGIRFAIILPIINATGLILPHVQTGIVNGIVRLTAMPIVVKNYVYSFWVG